MFNLNKKLLLISTLSLPLLFGSLFVGCTNQNNTDSSNSSQIQNTVKNVNFTDLEKTITESNLLTCKAMTLEAKDFPAFTDIQDKIESGYTSRALINVRFEDVVVVKTSDTKAVIDALNSYLKSDTVKLFADGYGSAENAKAVQNAKIEAVGDYVYFIAAPNANELEELILNSLK